MNLVFVQNDTSSDFCDKVFFIPRLTSFKKFILVKLINSVHFRTETCRLFHLFYQMLHSADVIDAIRFYSVVK